MKIPTQQNNVKRTALVIAGMAVVTGLAVPTATFAQNGDRSERGGAWSRDDRRGGHNESWNNNSWSWWERISAEDFTSWNATKLAKIDKYIDRNNLTIQDGEALRSAVDTNASALANSLTTLEELRDSIGDIKDASDEERMALKEQSTATFSAYYDYKLSLYDYKVAIKAAASEDSVKLDSSLDDNR